MSEDIPKVEPKDIPDYKYKNSTYEMMPKLPAGMLCVASSTGGKTVLIQNRILKIYRNSRLIQKRSKFIMKNTTL